MKLHPSELQRFQLEGLLGEGADFQVFAATDTRTGIPVVVKRPHPAYITRGLHTNIERRLGESISTRDTLRGSLPHVAGLIAHTPVADHGAYFGDSLGETYTVTVEQRAEGIPLVGSVSDAFKGLPVGLPQNLFVLHPLVMHTDGNMFSVARDLIDVAQAFHDAGFLLLDLRPQNVYYNPKEATITVIDVGSFTREQIARGRREHVDLHNFYLEMFKWYVTPADPPIEFKQYAKPYGMKTEPEFTQTLDNLIYEYSTREAEPSCGAAVRSLQKIRSRSYQDINEFRQDFEEYLSLVERRYIRLSFQVRLLEAWKKAILMFDDEYWRRFLFDPGEDLTHFDLGITV